MKPHKTKVSYPQIAEMLEIPVEDIQAINDFYWKEIRQKMSALVSPKITLIGLGDMRVKYWRMDDRLTAARINVTKSIRFNTPDRVSPIYAGYVEDLQQLEALKILLDQDNDQKLINKQKRLVYGI